MNVVYREKAQPEEAQVLEQATEWLKEALENTSAPVEAEWDQVEDDHGRSAHRLKLRDFAGQVEARFAPQDLQRTNHLRVRVYKLLGQLLDIRNHELLRRLRGANREEENGPNAN